MHNVEMMSLHENERWNSQIIPSYSKTSLLERKEVSNKDELISFVMKLGEHVTCSVCIAHSENLVSGCLYSHYLFFNFVFMY